MRASAIVAATTKFEPVLGLDNLPQAAANASHLYALLQSEQYLGIAPADLHLLIDPEVNNFYDALDSVLSNPPDQFVLYYCGHGEFHENQVLFPMAKTRRSSFENTSLNPNYFAKQLRQLTCPVLVIVDTCFSDMALNVLSGPAAVAEATSFWDPKERRSRVSIAAAERYAAAMHPSGANTLFTGELIDILRNSPPLVAGAVNARSVYDELVSRIVRRGGPAPTIRGDASTFTLGRPASRLTMSPDNPALGLQLYGDDTDEAFLSDLARHIATAQDEIVVVSMGLSLLGGHGHAWAKRIKESLRKHQTLAFTCLFGDPSNAALKQRIREEAEFARTLPDSEKSGFFKGWQKTFYEFIKNEITYEASDSMRSRSRVGRLTYFPTATIVKVDDYFFFRPYGPPSVPGRMGPWLGIDATSFPHAPWLQHLRESIDYAKVHACFD